MFANMFFLHLPLTPGVGSFSFLKEVMVIRFSCNQLNKNKSSNTMRANVLLSYTPLVPVLGHNVRTFFSEGYDAIKMVDSMHPLAFWVG